MLPSLPFIIIHFLTTYGTLVLSCTPCHPPISFSSNLFTIFCCASIPIPRKRSLATSIAYMLPQPPDTSRTINSAGCRPATNCSKTARSLSSRSAGGSSGACGCDCGCAAGALYFRIELVHWKVDWKGRGRAEGSIRGVFLKPAVVIALDRELRHIPRTILSIFFHLLDGFLCRFSSLPIAPTSTPF
jgi:hypothetical protein